MRASQKPSNITPQQRVALEHGVEETATLSEILAIDQLALFTNIFPNAPEALMTTVRASAHLGIATKMRNIGAAIQTHLPENEIAKIAEHTSDTVRGWACFAIAQDPANQTPKALLPKLKVAADDPHFGVREWAWMAARPTLTSQLDSSIEILATWTSDPSERIRRFASESLRPRGVWSKHISELKEKPELGLPILEPLRADPSKYVQDSVSNWINDAAKSRPDWAIQLAHRWEAESPATETRRIIKRGLRSINRN